jgi:hypothetical protein
MGRIYACGPRTHSVQRPARLGYCWVWPGAAWPTRRRAGPWRCPGAAHRGSPATNWRQDVHSNGPQTMAHWHSKLVDLGTVHRGGAATKRQLTGVKAARRLFGEEGGGPVGQEAASGHSGALGHAQREGEAVRRGAPWWLRR